MSIVVFNLICLEYDTFTGLFFISLERSKRPVLGQEPVTIRPKQKPCPNGSFINFN